MKSSNLGNYFESFVVGEEIKHSLSKTIFESDNNFFSLLTMNHHPVHTNVDFCEKHHQHGKVLVVGTLVLSIVVGMTVPDISGRAIANLGYEEVKHLAPVFINDTIYCKTTVIDKWETSKADRGIIYVETKATNQHDDAVLSFKRKVLIKKENG